MVRQQYTRLTSAVLVVCLTMIDPKPLVSVACLCEKVLNEKDGVMTLVRVVDRFFVSPQLEGAEKFSPHLVLTLVLAIKANGNVGKHKLGFQLHGSTESQPIQEIAVEFLEDNPRIGANVVVQVAIGTVKNFGEKRFDVTFDGEFLTAVPFTIERTPEPNPVG